MKPSVNLFTRQVPPILLVLSLLSGGVVYKDGQREISIWLSRPLEQLQLPADTQK
ncbi:hypothetical protein [Allocoleopsis franciscana]|uniref:Uncharacterized protein n=1 Tax=Allocoleopsis franciscana PCC 7113 TaxID=1173027 RepID=K9W6W8_9CYAN|nr:hypothetical protein [Allocoleopsis franciscana]AFZ16100.1 hypothetical protein Mic7113_0163 [Allocoleopsis franciscana PCC 7113]